MGESVREQGGIVITGGSLPFARWSVLAKSPEVLTITPSPSAA
jgi:hypothetical protein